MTYAVVGAWTVGDTGGKPHHPVRLAISAKPNSIMMKTLKALVRLGPDLPFGPLKNWREPELMASDDYVGCLTKLEEDVLDLMGLDTAEKGQTAG